MYIKALLPLLCILSASLSIYAKKDTAKDDSPANLAEWVQQQKDVLPATVDGVTVYRPTIDNGNAVISGLIDIPDIDKERVFVAMMVYAADNLDLETEKIDNVDYSKKRFVVARNVSEGEGKDAATYTYNNAFQAFDGIMSFLAYEISIGYREKGIIPRTLAFEKLKPEKNTRHKELIENFSILNSKYLDGMARFVKNADNISVSHWDEINARKIVKGMNATEVKLIAGRPRNITESGSREKWMYNNDFVVVFTDGIVSNVVQ